jgi:protein SSD1
MSASGHVVSIVHRTPGQLFSGTLGLLRPSSAATKEKQEAERRERDGVDIRGGGNDEKAKARICWFKPVDKRYLETLLQDRPRFVFI